MPIETTEENNAMRDLERKPYSSDGAQLRSPQSSEGPLARGPQNSETLRVRCPHCRKLYMVQYGDVKEAKPRFECVQCHNRFWLAMADMDFAGEVVGLPIEVKVAPAPRPSTTPRVIKSAVIRTVPAKDLRPCPKCFKPVENKVNECPHCGVLIDKVKAMTFKEDGVGRSEALAGAWNRVIANYADENVHNEFMRLAQKESNLAYAGAQYGQMEKLMADDEITKKRLGEVRALASVIMPGSEARLTRKRAYARIWQVPLVAATMLMLIGLFLPVFRNLVGFGAAILFIALAMQIQTYRRS